MGYVAAILQGLGGTLGAGGAQLDSEAKRESLRYDIKALRENQALTESQISYDASRIRSENVVSTAASGVRQNGSPAEVMAANAGQAARQLALSRFMTDAKIEQLQFARKQQSTSGGLGVASQLLGGGGGAASSLATS